MKYLVYILMFAAFVIHMNLNGFAQEAKNAMPLEQDEHISECGDGELIRFDPVGTILPTGCDLMVGDWVFTFEGQTGKDTLYCIIQGEDMATGDITKFHVDVGDEAPTLLPYDLEASQCMHDSVFILDPQTSNEL